MNVSLQPTSLQRTHDVTISAGYNKGRQQDSLRFGQDSGRDSYGGGNSRGQYVNTDRQYGEGRNGGANYNGRPDSGEEAWPPRRAPPLRRDRYNVDEPEDDADRRRLDDSHLRHNDDDKEIQFEK